MTELTYKSFCWSFGTTSFRTKNFNKTIEEQLRLIGRFWLLQGTEEIGWENETIQEKYYDFLVENKFITGNASIKDKDAREKTSGLVDIGLINDERIITDVGKELLNIADNNDYEIIAPLHIPKDSYLYFKQLLKFGVGIDGKYIRPFVVILYALSKLEYLKYDEFTYLIPLCIDKDITNEIIDKIVEVRKGGLCIDDIILEILLKKDNYSSALKYLLDNDVTSDLICEIGMNRKSRNYDRVYYDLYKLLKEKYVNHTDGLEQKIFDCISSINNIGIYWKQLLFDTSAKSAIKKDPSKYYKKSKFDSADSEIKFKKLFFEYMHLFKTKATLEDYFDLNRRYIRTTNCITFNDGIVMLDTIPKIVIKNGIDKLYGIINEVSCDLNFNVELNNICDGLDISEKELLDLSAKEFNKKFDNINDLYNENEIIRYKKFNELIDNKFSNDKLVELLSQFEDRSDSLIINYLQAEADAPTIFEYVLGIIWYVVSERKGRVLDYMKLSLDADLLPRTHAAGGESDIVYEYEETESYPKHTMLLEATLADKTNQRRMEMEPVSRHLGDYILKSNNRNDYCTFITNYLDANVISDFRQRKNQYYYDRLDNSKFIEGMKIIMLETKLLKHVLEKNINYKKLYDIFDEAYKAEGTPLEWYKRTIEKAVLSL